MQQLHYKLIAKDKNGKRLAHFRDGSYWYYGSYENWQQLYFRFWSVRTTRRVFNSLKGQNLIITKKFRKSGWDHKKWYTINYSAIAALEIKPSGSFSTSSDVAKLATSCNKISYSEISSKTHPHRNPATDTCVGAIGSRFSREICEQYAEHLFSTKQGIKNPMGFAKQIFRTGEEDSKIEAFLVKHTTLSIDVNQCPDCLGKGVRPHSSGKGFVKCQHLSLIHSDIN